MPKTPEWAAALTGITAERIRTLARQMAAGRTLVTVSPVTRLPRGRRQLPA